MKNRLKWLPSLVFLLCAVILALGPEAGLAQQAKKPNILVIMGDDIRQANISAYSHGVVGYKTQNIDRIAKEGMTFTDYYAEQSCTAGRSTFITARTEYADGMIEHDNTVGMILKTLDDLGIANDTIVLYTTDNGPHANSWPDGAITPFRSEKNTNWEGAFRVPCMIRWPGHIAPGSVSNEMISGLDWFPTLLAAAGDAEVTNKLRKGHVISGNTYKVHLDGYNQLPYLTGKQPKSARNRFFYFNDDGDLVAARYENWKIVFLEQRAQGTLQVWMEPFTALRFPKMFDLRADPYERADVTSNTYNDWLMSKGIVALGAQAVVGEFLATFKEFQPSQRAATFTIDQAMEKMRQSVGQ